MAISMTVLAHTHTHTYIAALQHHERSSSHVSSTQRAQRAQRASGSEPLARYTSGKALASPEFAMVYYIEDYVFTSHKGLGCPSRVDHDAMKRAEKRCVEIPYRIRNLRNLSGTHEPCSVRL